MISLNPYDHVYLCGDSVMRCVTLAWPREELGALLPAGLTLGPQRLTPDGTHPLVLLFNEMARVQMTTPSLLPSLAYRELSVGVPYCLMTGVEPGDPAAGPYYFQPRLFLDSVLATLGGRAYWGFPKVLARFVVDAGTFHVLDRRGGALTELGFEPAGPAAPIVSVGAFAEPRAMFEQPLLLQLPMGEGPLFVCADFNKLWERGTLRPLRTRTAIIRSFLPMLRPGRFPSEGMTPGLSDDALLGSYELTVPWRLSMAYSPFARRPGA